MKQDYTISILAVTVVVLFVLVPSSYGQHSSNHLEKRIIYVDDSNIDGPWNGTYKHPYRYIQDAVDVSVDDDIIYIYDGTYNESLCINTSISLIGENTPVINGSYRPILVKLSSSNVTLQNLRLQNSGGYTDDAGVLLTSPYAKLINCVFYRIKTAVVARNSSYHRIENCTFFNNGISVSLKSTREAIITDCTFGKNSIGIHCDNTSYIRLCSSYFYGNGRACFFTSSQHCVCSECNISENSVNHGGVFLDNCRNISFINSVFRHNGISLYISESKFIGVHWCTLSYNTHFGIVATSASFEIHISSLNQNNIHSNMLYGIYVKDSESNMRGNYWGSAFGPSQFSFGEEQRIHMVLGRVKSYPWETHLLVNTGANWTHHKPYLDRMIQDEFIRPIYFEESDSDGDGAPDWWETKWGYNPFEWENHSDLDPDHDALNNIEECYTDAYGSNPFHADIFLEIDWMESTDPHQTNKPDARLITLAEEAFEQHNITLHVDVGEYDGGEELPFLQDLSFLDVLNIYWKYFLHNDLNNPRKGIFRYGIICDVGPDINFPFIGWDQLDSFVISAQQLSDQFPLIQRNHLIMEASIHHLGHTLGLLADVYGGIDNVDTLRPLSRQWYLYWNYKSCMNYWYKYKMFSYSDGTHGAGDFDDYGHLNFHFFKNTSFLL
jgi:parallel beta-helix repeat protein